MDEARITRCVYCRKRIHKQRNGEWYHNHNASVACRPGEGSDRRATPSLISAELKPNDEDA